MFGRSCCIITTTRPKYSRRDNIGNAPTRSFRTQSLISGDELSHAEGCGDGLACQGSGWYLIGSYGWGDVLTFYKDFKELLLSRNPSAREQRATNKKSKFIECQKYSHSLVHSRTSSQGVRF